MKPLTQPVEILADMKAVEVSPVSLLGIYSCRVELLSNHFEQALIYTGFLRCLNIVSRVGIAIVAD
ncbi:MAG: hypothetical protein Q7U82_00120 [Gammaproteobacteria bacterium]|nr:hypothetical protein [Gammaproteobacteria bacterium]